MAGVSVDHNAAEIAALLTDVLARSADATPAMAEIAGVLELSTRERFDTETAPDGTPWAPHSEATRQMRLERGVRVARILHGSTLNLRDEIHTHWDSDSVDISTGQVSSAYAAMQQFGGTASPKSMIPGAEIPARPFLGISDDDADQIQEILRDFLSVG